MTNRLQRRIIEGRFPHGDRLPSERTLAAELGVNRTSVREALKTLESIGMVEIKPRSGVFVRSGSPLAASLDTIPAPAGDLVPSTILECLEARQFIEVGAIDLLRNRITDKDLDRLKGLVQAAEHAESETRALDLDRQFHIDLNNCCANSILAQAATNAFDALWGYYQAIRDIPNRRETSQNRHRAIVEALSADDFEKAKVEVSSHLQELRDALTLLYSRS